MEHHALVAVRAGHSFTVQLYRAIACRLQAADDPHEGGLPASGRPQVDDKFAGTNVHGDVVDDMNRTVRDITLENLADTGNSNEWRNAGHLAL